MFSLIWYFGLISFVVSAHSNNDTLHGGYKLNISTTMSTLPSATIPVAKDCVLEMQESEISEIVELFNSARVHVVDIHVSFSNTSHDKELSDFHVKLLNPVGREILYSLKRWDFSFVTWTLNAGIRNFKLHLNESQNDCIERQKNVTDFAMENMQNIVRRVNLATNYEVWYSFKETSSGKVLEICCQITKHNLPKCNHGCSTENSFLYASDAPWIVIFVMMLFFALFYLLWLLHVFLSRTEFDLEYPKYYKLEESRMSPSFILFKIIFEKSNRVVSFVRSCVLVGVFSCFTYLISREDEKFMLLMLTLSVSWGLSFLIFYLYRSKITNSSILQKIRGKRKNWSLTGFHFTHDVNEIRQGIESGESAGVIKILTLPFNIRDWIKTIKMLYDKSAALIKSIEFRYRILKTLAQCFCCVLAVLISALFVSIEFLLYISLAVNFLLIDVVRMLYLIYELEYKYLDSWPPQLCLVLGGFHCFYLVIFLVVTFFAMTIVILSFLLGLFLNLIYFIPYFALFSVLTFYCGNYWKTMEEKYLVLKRLIYEECRDIQRVNNGCIPNRHPKREEKVLPVVSKELYNKIREKLLPYDTNLFYFGMKMFWAFVFSFGIFSLIDMLNEFNVTGLVQVITTASLGVMPHIFNMVALKTSEEKKKVWEEQLKLNVKYMVEDLVREDPELARTVLIRQQNNGTTSDENVLGSENSLGSELTELLIIQESNDTTADENVRDSEKTACLPKLLARLCCNNDATTEHSSENDDDLEDTEQMQMINVKGTTADVNVQGSANVQVSDSDMNATNNDDAEGSELTELLIIQENNNTTADENVHDSKKTEGSRKLLTRACCNNDATTDENVQDSEHPCVDDDVEDPELTRLLQEVYGTTTDENVPDYEDPELTRLLEEVYGTTTDKNVHDSEHPSDNDDLFDPELIRRLTSLREVPDTTPDDIVHKIEHIEARSGLNPPDNDNFEDPEVARTALIIEGINDAPADEIDQHSEDVQGTSDLNRPDRDDMEEFPIAIVDAQKSRGTTADENVQDYERIEARSDLNSPDNDDMEELPIVIIHAQENNDTTADENVQDSERALAGSGLNPQSLRDNREENVQDYELVEARFDNDDENA